MEHPFRAYLRAHGQTQQWASERATELGGSLSQGHLSDLLSGKQEPSLAVAELLERISDGEVRAEQIAAWHLNRRRDDAMPAGGDLAPTVERA